MTIKLTKCITIALIILLTVSILGGISIIDRTKTYYYPEVGLYLSTKTNYWDDFGFLCVARSRDSLSKGYNSLKIYKEKSPDIILLVDTKNNTRVYYTDPYNLSDTLNPVSFDFETISRFDGRFFNITRYPIIECNDNFFPIFVKGYLQGLSDSADEKK